ncbi:MAG: IMP dehydrogenase [Euryarchaeota archaeon]|nr:IMP dehydrogenase [Euryarchaeota archaeon]
MESIPLGLTFDDVLLVPRRAVVRSRKDISTRSPLSRHIALNVPLASANMDTVTESAMAITLAREGGIGIIHRFMSIEQEVAEVLRVKRAESYVVDQPYTMTPDHTLRDAREFMSLHRITGLLVVEDGGRLIGILTGRDIRFESDPDKKISKLMTPREELVTAPPGTSLEEAKKILQKHKIEKLPLVDKEGVVRGLITGKDILKITQFPQATKDPRGRLRVGAAIGVKGDYIERAGALKKAGCDVLVLDIAHGHSDFALSAVKDIRERLGDVELIAGNVATAEGTRDLINSGVDAVKVGVGPGSTCTTRIVTGAGVPQLTAVMECAREAEKKGVPVIADGGIRTSGDITKALAAGASTAMLGNLFAGTEESPGVTIMRNGARYKLNRGMASMGATISRYQAEMPQMLEDDLTDVVPEGVEAMVPFRGSAVEIAHQLVGGLRSGISYLGARDIEGLRKNAKFVRITEAGMKESRPHDVDVI